MSADEEKATKERILVDYAETKKTLAVLEERALKLGREFEALGTRLQSKDKITNISVDAYQSLLSKETYDTLGQLKADIRQAESESARLTAKMREVGYGHMLG